MTTPGEVPLEVRVGVGELLARYAELIDEGDFDGIGELLARSTITIEDGTVVAEGREEVRRFYERFTRRLADGTPRTQHQITNLILEPEAGTNRFVARSSFVVFQATDDLALQPIIAGRYRDVVEMGDDGVVGFRERRMVPRLSGVLEHHLHGPF